MSQNLGKTLIPHKLFLVGTPMVSVQNLLLPYCWVLGKDTLWHFSLLGDLGSSSKFQSYVYKTKKTK